MNGNPYKKLPKTKVGSMFLIFVTQFLVLGGFSNDRGFRGSRGGFRGR